MVAENILCSGSFCTSTEDRNVYENNYENSSIRAWLNGLNYNIEDFSNNGFINKAFSTTGINNILTVNVDNSSNSTGYTKSDLRKVEKYICNNTNDKVFLLSEHEVTNKSYGFSDYKDNDKTRIRKTTDYARATTSYSNNETEYMNNGWWWLRTPNCNYSNFARGVKYDGDANSNYQISFDRIAGGIIPALSIN